MRVLQRDRPSLRTMVLLMTDTPTLASALAELQTRLPHIKKASKAQYGQYADLADVSKLLLPLMGSLGLSFTAIPTLLWTLGPEEPLKLNDPVFVLEYTLWHGPSGDFIRGRYPLPQGKPQDLGSAITYARRYALCAVTGAVADEDDDGQAAQKAATRQQRGNAPQRTAAEQPKRADGRVKRSEVTDNELAATGQMTGQQLRAHNKGERDMLGTDSDGKVKQPQGEKSDGLDQDDPWYDPPNPPELRAPRVAPDPLGAIMAHFKRIDYSLTEPAGRNERIAIITKLVGHEVKSVRDLTAGEGIAVKNTLSKCKDRGALVALLAEQELADADPA